MEGAKSKESLAMARARELNRTNEKRLSAEMNNMLQDLRRKMEKIKVERRSTREFINTLKSSSGVSEKSLMPTIAEVSQLENMIQPRPKMKFGFSDYKTKKAMQSSHSLVVQPITSAREGNPIPLRSVQPWTSSTARIISRKTAPAIAHPGRRRNSIESEISSDDDEVFSDLTPQRVKRKSLLKTPTRRQSLPAIAEKKYTEDTKDDKNFEEKPASKMKRRYSCVA